MLLLMVREPIVCLHRPSQGRRLSGMIAGCCGVAAYEYRDPAELPEIRRRALMAYANRS
jgi:hypothetical protein